MLKCNGKTFMNFQEAVQWLLNNNALFFMCNEDYAADTEISLEELVNPSPANPKIGSLVLFADGKISPITGITDDSFTVGSDYTDIRFVKSVDHFSIDASQHLIVTYTDGTSEDLGAIFAGDIHIDGVLTADTAKIFEDIVDKDGHARFIEGDVTTNVEGVTVVFGKWSLSGSHLMFVASGNVANGTVLTGKTIFRTVDLPKWVYDKIYPNIGGTEIVCYSTFIFYGSDFTSQNASLRLDKNFNGLGVFVAQNFSLTADRTFRIVFDLLIDNE